LYIPRVKKKYRRYWHKKCVSYYGFLKILTAHITYLENRRNLTHNNFLMTRFTFLLFTVVLIFSLSCQKGAPTQEIEISEANWWPEQPAPEGLIVAKEGSSHGENALIASVAGLVGKAQKNGDLDELVWIETGGLYKKWYSSLVDRIGAEERGSYDALELLQRYQDKGIIEGYILYNPEENSELRNDMDFSYNIAASYAGVENAIIIDETLEPAIKELGYSLIVDARKISRNDYFDNIKDRKNRNLIVTMSPSFHNNIDFAIANNAMVSYNTDEVTDRIMQWVNPISPVVGWNHGEEHVFTRLASQYGLFNTASDWASNLISLSAGASRADFQKVNKVDPNTIDFEKEGNFHSFVMSDGDNMQWTIGSFIDSRKFWGNASHGEYPLGFSSCPINLSLMAPDVLDELCRTQPEQTTIIEYGPGGYQFPDIFGEKRKNQKEVQRQFAQKINRHMQRTGTTVLGFIGVDIRSQDAIEAYQIYAEEIENLTGMLGVQYAPYHGGEGDVIWVENKEGLEIPVVTARYSLWKDLDFDERGGNVKKVANVINSDVEGKTDVMNWTIVHAWSNFENPADRSEIAGGLEPISWTIEQMNEEINIVSPEELLWRIRMKNNPDQTISVISN
jgi:hypothetical protein